MGAAIFVVLFALVIMIYDTYRLPGWFAAVRTGSPPGALGDTPQKMAKNASLIVTLQDQNGSGQDGTATLYEREGKTVVMVEVQKGTKTPQPAHLHMGMCPKPGGVKYPLVNVVEGKSETTLDVPLSQLLAELPLAVNIHKSAAIIDTYVACGNIQ